MGLLQIASPDAETIKVYEHVSYDQKTYSREKQIAEQFRETHGGLLPTGKSELGGQFWDYIRWREQVADASGHAARFDAYHPCVSKWLHEDYVLRHPIMPPTLPPVILPHPCPPPGNTPPIVIHPPSGEGSPGIPSAVPEPLSAWMFGIGIIVALIACRLFHR